MWHSFSIHLSYWKGVNQIKTRIIKMQMFGLEFVGGQIIDYRKALSPTGSSKC